jgi:speckle-type POZ protein
MAELFGPMKERTSARVRVDDMDAGAFKAMLHFVYTDALPDTTEEDDGGDEKKVVAMAQHLLVAADRYGIDRLRLICEDKLCGYVDARNVGTILALAEPEQHHCSGLKRACFKLLMSGNSLKAASCHHWVRASVQ